MLSDFAEQAVTELELADQNWKTWNCALRTKLSQKQAKNAKFNYFALALQLLFI